jgi:hypothetical protein
MNVSKNLVVTAAFALVATAASAAELGRPEVRSVSESRSGKSWLLAYETPSPDAIADALASCAGCTADELVTGILATDTADALLPEVPAKGDDLVVLLDVPAGRLAPSVSVVIARAGLSGLDVLARGTELDLESPMPAGRQDAKGFWLTVSSHCFPGATRVDFELHPEDRFGVFYEVFRRQRAVGGGDWIWIASLPGSERILGHSVFDTAPDLGLPGETEYMVVAKAPKWMTATPRPRWYVLAVATEKSDC